jgi:hypothetical protein
MVESRPEDPAYPSKAPETNSTAENGHGFRGRGQCSAMCSCGNVSGRYDTATSAAMIESMGKMERTSAVKAEVRGSSPGGATNIQASHFFPNGAAEARKTVPGALGHAPATPRATAGLLNDRGSDSGVDGAGQMRIGPDSDPPAHPGVPRTPPERDEYAGLRVWDTAQSVSASPALSCVEPPTVAPVLKMVKKPAGHVVVQATPYDHARLGAPAPPCEASRAAAAAEVFGGRLQSDPEFGQWTLLKKSSLFL